MEKSRVGFTAANQAIYLYTLETDKICLTISDVCATITNLWVKDKKNQWLDIVLGYEQPEDYLTNTRTYFGGTIGRNANRIEQAVATIAGKKYQLTKNDGENNLHGGIDGFQLRLWSLEEMSEKKHSLVFSLISEEGDQGFPGQLKMSVCYQLQGDELTIRYSGETSKTTVFNPTNHTYFNLNGHNSGDILDHTLQLDAKEFTVLKADGIPTGTIQSVVNTPLDFLKPKKIGEEIEHEQLYLMRGYDHNYVINKEKQAFAFFSTIFSEESGIQLKLATDLPGVQFYTANFIENERGKEQSIYQRRAGFCLETQYFPNAVNDDHFQSPLLIENESKQHTTVYKFERI